MKRFINLLLDRMGYGIYKRKFSVRKGRLLYKKYGEYTMIPVTLFIDNLELVSDLNRIEGSVVECGVWRGGMIAAMADIMPYRNYYLFDSFEGLPPATKIDGNKAIEWQKDVDGPFYFNNCKAEIEFAQKAMSQSNSKFEIVKGWFNDTLPNWNPVEQIAILRLDGDWYDSIMICLTNLYPKVVQGGLIILDDYFTWDGCSKAVHDYLSSIKSAAKIYSTNQGTAYIIKQD